MADNPDVASPEQGDGKHADAEDAGRFGASTADGEASPSAPMPVTGVAHVAADTIDDSGAVVALTKKPPPVSVGTVLQEPDSDSDSSPSPSKRPSGRSGAGAAGGAAAVVAGSASTRAGAPAPIATAHGAVVALSEGGYSSQDEAAAQAAQAEGSINGGDDDGDDTGAATGGDGDGDDDDGGSARGSGGEEDDYGSDGFEDVHSDAGAGAGDEEAKASTEAEGDASKPSDKTRPSEPRAASATPSDSKVDDSDSVEGKGDAAEEASDGDAPDAQQDDEPSDRKSPDVTADEQNDAVGDGDGDGDGDGEGDGDGDGDGDDGEAADTGDNNGDDGDGDVGAVDGGTGDSDDEYGDDFEDADEAGGANGDDAPNAVTRTVVTRTVQQGSSGSVGDAAEAIAGDNEGDSTVNGAVTRTVVTRTVQQGSTDRPSVVTTHTTVVTTRQVTRTAGSDGDDSADEEQGDAMSPLHAGASASPTRAASGISVSPQRGDSPRAFTRKLSSASPRVAALRIDAGASVTSTGSRSSAGSPRPDPDDPSHSSLLRRWSLSSIKVQAATKVQAQVRGNLARRHMRTGVTHDRLRKERDERQEAAAKVQAVVRGRRARKEAAVLRKEKATKARQAAVRRAKRRRERAEALANRPKYVYGTDGRRRTEEEDARMREEEAKRKEEEAKARQRAKRKRAWERKKARQAAARAEAERRARVGEGNDGDGQLPGLPASPIRIPPTLRLPQVSGASPRSAGPAMPMFQRTTGITGTGGGSLTARRPGDGDAGGGGSRLPAVQMPLSARASTDHKHEEGPVARRRRRRRRRKRGTEHLGRDTIFSTSLRPNQSSAALLGGYVIGGNGLDAIPNITDAEQAREFTTTIEAGENVMEAAAARPLPRRPAGTRHHVRRVQPRVDSRWERFSYHRAQQRFGSRPTASPRDHTEFMQRYLQERDVQRAARKKDTPLSRALLMREEYVGGGSTSNLALAGGPSVADLMSPIRADGVAARAGITTLIPSPAQSSPDSGDGEGDAGAGAGANQRTATSRRLRQKRPGHGASPYGASRAPARGSAAQVRQRRRMAARRKRREIAQRQAAESAADAESGGEDPEVTANILA